MIRHAFPVGKWHSQLALSTLLWCRLRQGTHLHPQALLQLLCTSTLSFRISFDNSFLTQTTRFSQPTSEKASINERTRLRFCTPESFEEVAVILPNTIDPYFRSIPSRRLLVKGGVESRSEIQHNKSSSLPYYHLRWHYPNYVNSGQCIRLVKRKVPPC